MDIKNLGLGDKLAAAFNLLCDVLVELFAILFSDDGGTNSSLDIWDVDRADAIGTNLTLDFDKLNDDR